MNTAEGNDDIELTMAHVLTVSWTADELAGLRQVLDRAMNTWEPAHRPTWLQALSDAVDRRMGVATFGDTQLPLIS